MSTITFTWNPDPAVMGQRVMAVANALDDRTIPLLAASEAMQADIAERFETKTDPEGIPWKRWSSSYFTSPYLPLVYNINGILERTGALKEAAVSSEAMVVTNDTVFYKTSVLPSYGLAHEEGKPDRSGGRGPNPLPKRSFLGMSDQAAMVVLGEFGEWFEGSIGLWGTSTGKVGRRHSIKGAGSRFIPRSAVGKSPMIRR